MPFVGTENIFITRKGQTSAKMVPIDPVDSPFGLLVNQPMPTNEKAIKAGRLAMEIMFGTNVIWNALLKREH